MAGDNFTLTRSNLVTVCSDDTNILYPLTISDQVVLTSEISTEETTLTQWIKNLVIPSPTGIDIDPEYDTGLLLATINDVPVYAPTAGYTNYGLIKINSDYFAFDGDSDSLVTNFQWVPNSSYGNSIIGIGSIRGDNNKLISNVTMPTPSLDYSIGTDNAYLQLDLDLGNTNLQQLQISKEDIQAIALDGFTGIGSYTLSVDSTGTELTLSDGTDPHTTTATIASYTAGTGINITGTGVQKTVSLQYGAGEGIDFNDDNNQIELKVATNNTLGGIKLGYDNTSSPNNKPLQVDTNGHAFIENVEGDGTLTFMLGTTPLGTFTANQTGDTTITIPTNLTYEIVETLPSSYNSNCIYLTLYDATNHIYQQWLHIGDSQTGYWAELGTTAVTQVQTDWYATSSSAPNYILHKPTISIDTTNHELAITTYADNSSQAITIAPMTGATATSDGTMGLVPAPTQNNRNKFLRGDGDWVLPPYPDVFAGATDSESGSIGLVPQPTTDKKNMFLRGDCTWATPTVPTVGDATINIVGGSGADVRTFGTFTTNQATDSQHDPYEITIPPMVGVTSSGGTNINGKEGLVPKPVAANGDKDKFLKGDGTWESIRPSIAGLLTNGISGHSFRVSVSDSSSSTQWKGPHHFIANTWIPLLLARSTNQGKCSIIFEVISKENSKTAFGKYYLNTMLGLHEILCLDFYTSDTSIFDYNDIKAAAAAIITVPKTDSKFEAITATYNALEVLYDNTQSTDSVLVHNNELTVTFAASGGKTINDLITVLANYPITIRTIGDATGDTVISAFNKDNTNIEWVMAVYKRMRNVTDSMFNTNILAENVTNYSEISYFYTNDSSIADSNHDRQLKAVYNPTPSSSPTIYWIPDKRVGTYDSSTGKITAYLTLDDTRSYSLDSYDVINGTYYNNKQINVYKNSQLINSLNLYSTIDQSLNLETYVKVDKFMANSLSAHCFKCGTSNGFSSTNTFWIPLIKIKSTYSGKCNVVFELIGREDARYYGKYSINGGVYSGVRNYYIKCLEFYSDATSTFNFDDIKLAISVLGTTADVLIFKKYNHPTNDIFIVNILSSDTVDYSAQSYYYTMATSIPDTTEERRITTSDKRLGAYNSSAGTFTTYLETTDESQTVLTAINVDNATYYNPGT